MPCPSTDDFLAFLDGRLAAPDSLRIEEHIDVCAECRELLASLGREGMPSLTAPDRTAPLDGSPATVIVHDSDSSAGLLSPGERVDQYTIVRQIGRGGMGEVYLARDTALGRRAALKVLRAEAVALRGAAERVLREARTTARFAHPHIVAIYGVGQVRGMPYLALEYVPGETLRQHLARGPLALETRTAMAAAVAAALAEAHRHHVMHGDLKPSNVLIGDDGRVRVLDFGLARVLREQSGTAVDVTEVGLGHDDRSGAIQGTPAYMAPEQWAGAPNTLASDLWAFGVMLYEMACGRLPFTLTAVARQEVDLQVALAQGVALSPNEVALLEQCLLVNPSLRARAEELFAPAGTPLIPASTSRSGDTTMDSARSEAPQARTAPPGAIRARTSHPALWLVAVAVSAVAGAAAFAGLSERRTQLQSTPARSISAQPGAVLEMAPDPAPLPASAPAAGAPDTTATTVRTAPRPPRVGSAAPIASSSGGGGGVGYISLSALSALEDQAEAADREARGATNPAAAQVARERAAMLRRAADDQLSGVEREVARAPDMPAADAARLREYVRRGREHLARRRAAAPP